MYLKPSDILFSQDSVNNVFDRLCSYSYKPIGHTLDALCEGRCSITSIPKISVMRRDGKWFTADNRRLWVFRQLERLGKCEEIEVLETSYIPSSKFTTYNGGVSIVVRRSPGGEWYNKDSARKPIRASKNAEKIRVKENMLNGGVISNAVSTYNSADRIPFSRLDNDTTGSHNNYTLSGNNHEQINEHCIDTDTDTSRDTTIYADAKHSTNNELNEQSIDTDTDTSRDTTIYADTKHSTNNELNEQSMDTDTSRDTTIFADTKQSTNNELNEQTFDTDTSTIYVGLNQEEFVFENKGYSCRAEENLDAPTDIAIRMEDVYPCCDDNSVESSGSSAGMGTEASYDSVKAHDQLPKHRTLTWAVSLFGLFIVGMVVVVVLASYKVI